MKHIIKMLIAIGLFLVSSCNGNIKNFDTINEKKHDSIVVVNEYPNKDILLTSSTSNDILLLYIPFEIEIKKQLDEEIFDLSSFIYDCGSYVENNIKYYPVKTPRNNELFTPDDLVKNPNQSKFIQYRYVKIFPKRDTIAKSFLNELKVIKLNCKESNKYFNDTIRYKSITEFIQKHKIYYDNMFECEKVKLNVTLKKDTIYDEYEYFYQFKK